MGATSSGRTRRNNRTKLLAAAIAAAGLTPLAGSRAVAGLMVDLRIAGVNDIAVTSGNRKSTFLNIGDTLTINVVARVSGTNAVQSVGNFDGANPATDTRNDDSIKFLAGAFQSVGGLKGDFQGDPNANQGGGNQVFPWNAPGTNNGIAQDFDSDGDLDLGALGTDPTTMWVARAATEYIPTVSKKTVLTRYGVSVAGATGSSAAFNEDVGGPNTAVPDSNIIDATTAETLIGELTWVFTGGGGTVSINFVPRSNGDAAALWFEDGVTTGKNPTNSAFTIGSPIVIPGDVSHNLVWNPAGAGGSTVWNSTQTNWLDGGLPSKFTDFDSVNFTNSGVGMVNITPSGVTPASVTISHTSGTYTFTGGPIKGSGFVAITGAGTTVFMTTNTYSGGTTIGGGGTLVIDGGDDRLGNSTGSVTFSGGILRTQSVGITSSRNFVITGAGGTFDSNGFDSSISGVLSGTGAFTKSGGGTLTLTGNNTHTGITTINAGTLQIGNGGDIGSIASASIVNNASLVFNRASNNTYAGDISGPGTLSKFGSSSLTLTGTNSFTGLTTISAGTIQVGNGGTTGTYTGDVVLASGSAFSFKRSDHVTYAGLISGSGTFTNTGSGITTLTANNSYAGGTSISAGTLEVGNGGTSGAIGTGSVAIAAGAALTLNRSDTITFAGNLSGNGAFNVTGGGTVVLTGSQGSLSVTTTVTNGTLQIGNGGASGAILGQINGPGTIAFNHSSNFDTFGGFINGAQLVQMGPGTLTLASNNLQTSTTVLGGTLAVSSDSQLGSGSPSNILDVRGGATLKLNSAISMSRTVLLGSNAGVATLDATGQTLSLTGTGGTGINGPVVLNGTFNFGRAAGGLVGVAPGASVTLSPGSTLNLSGAPIFFDGVDRVDVITNATASFAVRNGSHDVGQISGAGNTTVFSSGTLAATHIRQGILTVNGTAAIRPNRTATGVSRVNTLNIGASGKLDLGDNKLIVNGGPLGTWNGSAYEGITGLVASGRNGNAPPLWDGASGIITTQSDSNLTSIGVARASDIRPDTVSETTVWAGQTISGSDVLVMYTYGGDATLDGKINIDDYIHIGTGRGGGLSGWSNGDFNYDGHVDIDDFVIIDSNIANQNGYIFPAAGGVGSGDLAGVTAIPEPAGLSLLGFGLSLVARRRRKLE